MINVQLCASMKGVHTARYRAVLVPLGGCLSTAALWLVLNAWSDAKAADNDCFCLVDPASENAIKDCERVRNGPIGEKVVCFDPKTRARTMIVDPKGYQELGAGQTQCQPCVTPDRDLPDVIRGGGERQDVTNDK